MARGLSTMGLALCLAACGGGDDGPEQGQPSTPPATSGPSQDIDIDPEQIEEYASKSDSDPCLDYPGGALDGADLLAWVNKLPDQQLSDEYAPEDLFRLGARYVMPGRNAELRLGAWVAFVEMSDDALAEEGFDLRVRSGYRSYYTQCITFDYKVQEHGYEHAFRYSAQPGRSQHQLGTTADITTPTVDWALSSRLAGTPEGMWLAANAWRYGFALSYPEGQEEITGYGFEPWHFRYIGRPAAEELMESGEILEVYLQRCAAGDEALVCPRAPDPDLEVNKGFIGGACEEAADCYELSGGICLTESEGYPGGACVSQCERYCPDLDGVTTPTVCVDIGEGQGLCHSRCEYNLFPEVGCREGYACQPSFRPNGAGPFMACLPL